MPIIAAPLPALAVLGFVLSGVPVYYLTRQQAGQPFSHDCERPQLPLVTDKANQWKPAWIQRFVSRIRGRRPDDEGWEAVATDADEPIEMSHQRPS